MPDTTRVGKLLFGNPTRLRLALWVLGQDEDKIFYQSEPPKTVGAPTAVRQELEKLVKLEMLAHIDMPGENKTYYVRRTESSLWSIIKAADSALDSPYSDPVG